jgi:hypothetical protein
MKHLFSVTALAVSEDLCKGQTLTSSSLSRKATSKLATPGSTVASTSTGGPVCIISRIFNVEDIMLSRNEQQKRR